MRLYEHLRRLEASLGCLEVFLCVFFIRAPLNQPIKKRNKSKGPLSSMLIHHNVYCLDTHSVNVS